MIDRPLQAIARLFERRQQTRERETWVLPVLALIVLLGAALRFWGLGAVGLHGQDEDTTALPAVHLAEHGRPEFPSGMFYARAIVQTYLIAGSVRVFGNSEWAIRLPSALCGVAMILLAHFVGRRFLSPVWNAAFVASVALLPDLILLSQNARMYIFLVTCIAAYTAVVFEWERTGRLRYLVAAVVLLLLGIQFQTLMIFVAPLLFIPGLLKSDWRSLLQAGLSTVFAVIGYVLIEQWVVSFYPMVMADGDGGPTAVAAVMADVAQGPSILVRAASGLAAVVLGWLVVRQVPIAFNRWVAWIGLSTGLVALLALHYHAGLLVLVASAVVAMRGGLMSTRPLVALGVICVALAIAQFLWLYSNGAGSRGVIADMMMGTPKAWPFLTFSEYSPAALAITFAGAALALWELARGRRIPDYWLFFLLGVWLPLFVIGAIRPSAAPRYLVGSLLPLLVGAFFVGQVVMARFAASLAPKRYARIELVAAVLLLAAVVKPMELARAVNAGYDIHPDHKGAAEFIQSLELGSRDVVLAEDVIMQTYYLGRVDYWFIGPGVGKKFARPVDGVWRDIYTNTAILTTSEEMQALIQQPGRGRVYIISSGENQSDGRRSQRGESLAQYLSQANLEVVYAGRDGVTKVWMVPEPHSPGD